MDAAKAEKLRKIGYSIPPSCGLCVHADLSPDGWGTCSLFSYEHEKHTGERRPVSINRLGYCPAWESDPAKIAELGPYQEFA